MSSNRWYPKLQKSAKEVEESDLDKERKAKERRNRVNGSDPEKNHWCTCGAKFDRHFPNVHSRWCVAYKEEV